MDESTDITLKRLAKRLSALRVTLAQDERFLLDRIILGRAVQGSTSLEKSYTGAKRGAAKNAASKPASAEVHGHGIHPAAPKALAPKDALLEFDHTTGGYRPTDGASH